MKDLFGQYRGYILRNDDPSHAGRVKVWVPAVHGKDFDLVDDNSVAYIAGLSVTEVEELTSKLPWANVSQPLVGGGGGSSFDNGSQLVVGDGVQFSGGTINVDSKGFVNPEELRAFLINTLKGSKLLGVTPVDGARYKIDGSAESWANFFVTLASVESSYKVGTVGDLNRTDIPSGSHGLFQLSPEDAINNGFRKTPYTLGELQNPVINTRVAIRIAERNLARDGNILASGTNNATAKGLARYWGPLRRGQVNPPPVPPFKPTDNINVSPLTPNDDPMATPIPDQKQKPSNAYTPSQTSYNVTNDTRDQMGGSSNVRKKGRPISLDFNSAGGRAGIFIVAPKNITPLERELCSQYVEGVSQFFARYSTDPKSKKISSNRIRVKGVDNDRGINGFFHTEPFDQDGAAMKAIAENPQEFANILASTLGKIPNALFLPPHKTNGGGGAVFNGVNERDFARKNIIPYLGGASGKLTGDAFSSVGNKHPEQTRDEALLKSIGAESSIEAIVKNGKDIYENRQKAKSDTDNKYTDTIKSLKEERTKLWEEVKGENNEDDQKKTDYLSRVNLDYNDVPLPSVVNPASQTFGHSPYNNVSRGSFVIPDVGASVWVFFEGGQLVRPVVNGSNPTAKDYAGIYDIASESPDYPCSKDGDEVGIERNKYFMGGRGGNLEINHTTGKERVGIKSYQGSSYEHNPYGTTEFTIGNKSQLTKGDSFRTIRGDDLSFVDSNREDIIKGDLNVKCGDVRIGVEVAEKMKELYKPIHEKMRLFDQKRTGKGHPLDTSSLQEKSGEHVDCPTCSGQNQFPTRVNEPSSFSPAVDMGGIGKSEKLQKGTSSIRNISDDTAGCFNCGGTGKAKWSGEGEYETDTRKKEITQDIQNTAKDISDLENQLGDGGNYTSYISKSHTVHIGTVMNDLESIRIDPKGKRALFAQIPSKTGKMVAPAYVPVPLIESVATNSLAGGDYTMMVSNKYNLLVGANGINMKTLGEYNIQGRILTLTGDQLIISSNNQVQIDGGKNVMIKGDSITLSPRTQNVDGSVYKNIALDGSVGVSSNMVIKGGVHVEGELSAQHITAPVEYQQTETTLSMSSLVPNKIIGIDGNGKPVTSVACKDCTISAHDHTFANAPMTLVSTNDTVRSNAQYMALEEPVLAQASSHGKANKKDYARIRYHNPELFALFEDCNNASDFFDNLIDRVSSGEITTEELKGLLTRSSDNVLNNTTRKDCDIDRSTLSQPIDDV